MRSRLQIAFGCLALILLAVAPVMAQEEGGREGRGGQRGRRGFGFGMGGMMRSMDALTLASLEQVQKEIKVTEEQVQKVDELRTAYREESRQTFSMQGWRDLTPEERQQRMEEMRAKREKLSAQYEKKLAAILKPEQMKRLHQIELQQGGVQALKDKKTVKALGITEEQIKKIDEALEWAAAEQSKMFEEMRANRTEGERPTREEMQKMREEMTAKREKITKEMEEKVMAALTKEQKEKYAKMKGEKFELDMQALMRGRMRGRTGGAEGGRPGAGEGRRGGGRRGGGDQEGGRQRPREL